MNSNNLINFDNGEFKLIRCYYCPLEFVKIEDYLSHSSKEHSREIYQPSKEMINKIRLEFGYNIQPKDNFWE